MSNSNSENNNSQGFENSWMDTRGCVWVGESFLNHDKWQIKLLKWIFFPIHIQHFMSDSNSENNNLQGFENSWMDTRGCVMSGGKFLKPWQVTDKIIE